MNVSVSTVSGTMITMVFVILVGYLARKLRFLDDGSTEKLAGLVLCVFQPFMIVSAILSIEFSLENLKRGGLVLAFCVVAHLIISVIALVSTSRIKNVKARRITEFAMIFANCGFFGFPIYRVVFGDIGVFYGSFYVLGFNIIAWSYGMSIIKKGNPEAKISVKQIFLNFGTVSSLVGIVLFLFRVKFPTPVMNAFDSLGSLCTPLSLVVVGSLLANIPLKNMFNNPGVYFASGMRLIVIPFAVAVVMRFAYVVGIPDEIAVFVSLAAAMPSASLAPMFGKKYDLYPDFGAQITSFSTVFSAVTIPLTAWFVMFIR